MVEGGEEKRKKEIKKEERRRIGQNKKEAEGRILREVTYVFAHLDCPVNSDASITDLM